MMTPARFEDEIKRIVESDDSILDQIEAYNRLTEETLRSLGYGQGIDLMFKYIAHGRKQHDGKDIP